MEEAAEPRSVDDDRGDRHRGRLDEDVAPAQMGELVCDEMARELRAAIASKAERSARK